jgi:lysozyme
MTHLEAMLIRHEGMKLRPYICTAGKLTIGVGRNLDDMGISESEALTLLWNDIERCSQELDAALPWWNHLDAVRRDVLVDMCFNLGIARLLKFVKFLGALKVGDFSTAALHMVDSKWAKQVGRRAGELAAMIETGEYQDA